MNFEKIQSVLTKTELAAFTLRSLYNDYGYNLYKMSKFEEYDLYVKNKDFLISDNVITFTDTDGRLLALKPDVTLSIIKNTRESDEKDQKLYYNENVYRVSHGTHSFKEIMQVGLECLGKVDLERKIEVIALAKKSLDTISKSNVLEISHLDIVKEILSYLKISDEGKKKIYSFLGSKNAKGIAQVCETQGLSPDEIVMAEKLVTVYEKADKVLPELEQFRVNEETSYAIDELNSIVNGLRALGIEEGIRIDFSVINDMRYYNGIAIKGFVEGIPTDILSGGQYDILMEKMKRKQNAIGFAVYLDELERLP